MSEQPQTAKMGRKPNWTHEEVVAMCDFVKQHREKLFGRAGHCSAKVESRKAKYWGKCAEVLRLQCGMERSASDVKTKWANMKVRANKYQSRKNRTGGGQAPTNNPTFEVILAAQAPQARFGIMGEEIEAGCSQSSASTSNGDETAEAMLMGMSDQVAAPSYPSTIVVASSRTASSSASSSASTSASSSASSSASRSAIQQVASTPSSTSQGDFLNIERQRLLVERELLELKREEVGLFRELVGLVRSLKNNES